MTWERMTIDEFAAFQRESGARVIKSAGTWWLEARPFFYRPLFPFSEVTPALVNYPAPAMIGGVLHRVPAGARANSCVNLFLHDHLEEYALEHVSANVRSRIRKGMQHFRAARITDPGSFIEDAYPVYRSFYDRSRYFYKKERTARSIFAAWCRPLFSNPKVVVMGGYRQDRLCAVDISYQVDDVIIDDVFFSDTESQRLQVTDFMLHVLREAARSSGASCIFRGFPSGKESLDQAKVLRGCRLLRLPAHCRINPLAMWLGKSTMHGSYRKLVAMTTCAESPAAGVSHSRPGGNEDAVG